MVLTLSRIRSLKMSSKSKPQRYEECPVCSAEMTEYIDHIDWMGPIAEHYAVCPNKCYSYEYAYGYTTVQIDLAGHNLMFGWSYSDDHQDVQAETEAIDVVCALARSISQDADKVRRSQESSQPRMDDGL